MEVGSYHVELSADADNVRVGEVCIKHRVLIGAVTLVSPTLGICLYKNGTGVGFFCDDLNVMQLHVAGMSDKETLGRQVTPHGGFWVGLFFLISDGIGNFLQFIGLHASFVMESDI